MNADFILECRGRWLAKLTASGRFNVPRGKAKRSHKKRHGENKERSYIDRRKAAKAKATQDACVAERRRRSAVMRAYFNGETADLSAL